jgi:hypothetical protein
MAAISVLVINQTVSPDCHGVDAQAGRKPSELPMPIA